MWVVLTDGFYSAVEDRNHRDRVVVRARGRGDLERLLDRHAILHRPARGGDPWRSTTGTHVVVHESSPMHADYPFRVSLTKAAWSGIVGIEASRISYPNFKDAVEDDHRHDVYQGVWAVLRGLMPAAFGGRAPAKMR